MPENRGWRGLYVALATPLGGDGAPDLALLAGRAVELLEQGCEGIALFGTTGEGPALPVEDRIAGLEALLEAGIAADRMVVSASAIAPADAQALTRHALASGVSNILLMPAFLFKMVEDEGLFRFYADHIERSRGGPLRLLLYHIPSVSGIGLSRDLIARLAAAFPEVIAGVKDSGFDFAYTRSLLERFPELAILTGAESQLPQAVAEGGAGTICGMANFMPALLRRLIETRNRSEAKVLHDLVIAAESAIDRSGSFHPALRSILADLTGEPAWQRCLPPMSPLPEARREALLKEFRRITARAEDVLARGGAREV